MATGCYSSHLGAVPSDVETAASMDNRDDYPSPSQLNADLALEVGPFLTRSPWSSTYAHAVSWLTSSEVTYLSWKLRWPSFSLSSWNPSCGVRAVVELKE